MATNGDTTTTEDSTERRSIQIITAKWQALKYDGLLFVTCRQVDCCAIPYFLLAAIIVRG